MTTQVDNGELYLACYCGPAPKDGGSPLRVEIRRHDANGPIVLPEADIPVLDMAFGEFRELVQLSVELVVKCAEDVSDDN